MTRPLHTLDGHQTITNVESGVKDLDARRAVIGSDLVGLGLQVLVCDWSGAGVPRVEAIRETHRKRLGKKIFPLVVATVDRNDNVWLMGPSIDAAPIGPIAASQAERILQATLNEPTGLQARQRLAHLIDSVRSTDIAGMTNAGLFATHYLTEGIRAEPGWDAAADTARPWLKLRGEPLIVAMGYTVKTSTANAHVLTTTGHNQPRAVAVLLNESETFDADSPRFAVSPVRFGLNIAQREDAPWLIVLRGSQVRLYAARPGVGVGARGQAETFFELDLALLDEQDAAYLTYSFSADGLCDGGLVQRLIEGSERYATGLGERLRQRVYDHVVPSLAVAVANEFDRLGYGDDLALAYRITLRILFRLLFQAYAEDRGLLPYGRNDRYTRNSLKRWAQDMVEQPDMAFDPESQAIWSDLQQVWGVIDTGDAAWDVPAYNGGLFGADPDLHPGGAVIKQLEVDNSVIGNALRHLLVDDTVDGSIGAVDFRSLSVREFGTIYEGLLESSLSRADQDLTLDKNNAYVPAKKNDTVVVEAGGIYFHNASGERKATGSYFTPHFAVEHLLERALEPALEQHLKGVADLLDSGDMAAATERFFDFRVADLAMGSGHFLVASIDHIEAGMAAFLVDHELPGITDELRRLEASAQQNLGHAAADYEIEPSALLRRQIARRCIYGLDINDVAVELARVAIWIHTFIPGLPMSSLDHNLVQANSLTGIGTIDEAIEALDPSHTAGQLSLYSGPILDALEEAKELLTAAANASEATKAEVRQSAEIHRKAVAAAQPTKLLFDAAVGTRTGIAGSLEGLDLDGIRDVAAQTDVAAKVAELQPAHMPFLFPEVFVRENGGFDAIVGNPPWEEATVEELGFWALRFPGLKSLSQKQQKPEIRNLRKTRPDLVSEYEADVAEAENLRTVLLAGPYPGMGTGDPDLYKAFVWRFWQLMREDGASGVVLPRSALSATGSTDWRRTVLDQGAFEDVTLLLNTGRWVFDMEPRYTVSFVIVRKGPSHAGSIRLRGPYSSLQEYEAGMTVGPAILSSAELATWTSNAAFPSLPSGDSIEVFLALRSHPRFDSTVLPWSTRPVTELHATNEKSEMILNPSDATDLWSVFKGASFKLWESDTGVYYAWADPTHITNYLQRKRQRQARTRSSAFYGMPAAWIADSDTLPCRHPRIAFRDIARATDTRTVITALLPPDVVITNKGPYLLFSKGDRRDEAYLLGVMSSIPFDWYARRFVEINLNFHILNAFPIPNPESGSKLRDRVANLSGQLAATDDSYQEWADAVGVEVDTLQHEPERSDAIAELDALVAHLYGLSEDQLLHIFETFHRGWDYTDRWGAVQAHYRAWEAKT